VDLAIDVVKRGDDTVLRLAGDIDIHSAPEITEQLTRLQGEGNRAIVVDLSGVSFLDSSALGALVAAHRAQTEAGGTLKIAAPRAHVLKVFRITRLSEVIPVFDSVEAACA
jgi:anti-sigma B factor antagonist